MLTHMGRGAKGLVPKTGTSRAAFPALLPSIHWELAELDWAGVEAVMELAVDTAGRGKGKERLWL